MKLSRARRHAGATACFGGCLLLSALPVLAHGDHGGGGDGGVLPPGITVVTLQYDYVSFRQISDARLGELAANGQGGIHSLTSIGVPSLSVARGLTENVTLGVRVPYLINSGIKETNADTGDVDDRGGVRGFGDISLTGTYRFLNDTQAGVSAAVILGFKAPTGRTNATDSFGQLFETEHQPGSGSWDGIVGGSVSRQMGLWSLGANALYTRAGAGSQDTRLGDRFNYGVSASYRLSGDRDHDGASHLGGPFDGMMRHGGVSHAPPPTPQPSFDVSLGLNGQWSGKQTIAGDRDDNTGGQTLFLTPGIRMTIDKWSTFVNVGIPVARQVNGIQSDPSLQVTTGVAVRF